MLKNDTLKNSTSRIGLYGSAPPRARKGECYGAAKIAATYFYHSLTGSKNFVTIDQFWRYHPLSLSIDD